MDAIFGQTEKGVGSFGELEEHFKQMVSNPNSALVRHVAFAVRHLEEDKREADQTTAG